MPLTFPPGFVILKINGGGFEAAPKIVKLALFLRCSGDFGPRRPLKNMPKGRGRSVAAPFGAESPGRSEALRKASRSKGDAFEAVREKRKSRLCPHGGGFCWCALGKN